MVVGVEVAVIVDLAREQRVEIHRNAGQVHQDAEFPKLITPRPRRSFWANFSWS